ncbi:DNA-binding protein MNB1B isoform X5 [Punica granatum]|uniref:DNA-binding protein MNB1B isoform X5 n=1 Tax=Punica granatum TaxID=22663 RepID=A0A6P8CE71_PUNGR|nr:DNA-binding protein MNB1B isoform X5 [Punica granatum]
MANPSRARKRVYPIRRAADGSAFEQCDQCGISVAIALADMHECQPGKKEVKRFRGLSANHDFIRAGGQSFAHQPRSAFCFFMESLRETSSEESFLDLDRKGFEMWKNMSDEEKRPYLTEAEKSKVEDGANSPMLWKFDKFLEEYQDHEDSDSSEASQSSDSYGWQWSSDDS